MGKILTNKWFLAVAFFGIYSLLINWKFAIVLMVSIGFHEYGHLWAAKRKGLSTGGFYFIPFMGGIATITENYRSFAQQAYVAIMGPIWGLILATATMTVGILTGNVFLTTTASWMAIFNVFNLIPVTFLDGGQILKTITLSITKKYGFTIVNVITIIAALLFLLKVLSPLVIIAAAFSVYQIEQERKLYLQHSNSILPKDLTKKQIALTIISYVVTAVLLLIVLSVSLIYTHTVTGNYNYMVK